jgi:hypothetical protein
MQRLICAAAGSRSLHVSHWHDELPALDVHTHAASDATVGQVRDLEAAKVFAVARSLVEAIVVLDRLDDNITWGCGTHPASRDAVETFTRARFEALVDASPSSEK